MTPRYVLYGAPVSPFVRKVRLVLALPAFAALLAAERRELRLVP